MSDTYQPIFDAVRSRLINCDVGTAVEKAIRDANIEHYVQLAFTGLAEAAQISINPSVLYRPKLSVDGDQWCALYGDDLQSGVAGFGNSPATAMQDFDKSWYAELKGKP